MIGFIWQGPLALVIAIGAVLGSLALMGSNSRTMDEAVWMLKALEERRSQLIEALELQVLEREEVE